MDICVDVSKMTYMYINIHSRSHTCTYVCKNVFSHMRSEFRTGSLAHRSYMHICKCSKEIIYVYTYIKTDL